MNGDKKRVLQLVADVVRWSDEEYGTTRTYRALERSVTEVLDAENKALAAMHVYRHKPTTARNYLASTVSVSLMGEVIDLFVNEEYERIPALLDKACTVQVPDEDVYALQEQVAKEMVKDVGKERKRKSAA